MVQWTAEKDQILLKGVFAFCDIRNSVELQTYLAELIGEGCTAKAVSHRLNNIKNSGKPVAAPGTPSRKRATTVKSTPTKGSPAKATPYLNPARAPTTPSKSRMVKVESEEEDDSDDLVEIEPAITPKRPNSARKQNQKVNSYWESDQGDDSFEEEYAPEVKKIKQEPIPYPPKHQKPADKDEIAVSRAPRGLGYQAPSFGDQAAFVGSGHSLASYAVQGYGPRKHPLPAFATDDDGDDEYEV